MCDKIHVNTARAYDILIERGILQRTGELCRAALPKAQKIAVVTDSHVEALYLEQTVNSLQASGFETLCCVVSAGESSKNAGQLAELWEKFMDFGLTRTDAVAALGGGMVGDLAGFAASSILRGVQYVQIPTTLLAQVDSSVGGKVAIDLKAGKNLAGAFWQPSLVIMDPDCLESLSNLDFSSGMAEVIKYGCIMSEDFFRFLQQYHHREKIMSHITEVLAICCDCKRRVVEEDERDTGLRMILNFGHTIGHAFELAGNYQLWTHGQAVAAGMCAAAQIGASMGITPVNAVSEIRDLVSHFDLPVDIPCSSEILEKAVGLDKKNTGSELSLIVLKALGQAAPYRMERTRALELLNALYKA